MDTIRATQTLLPLDFISEIPILPLDRLTKLNILLTEGSTKRGVVRDDRGNHACNCKDADDESGNSTAHERLA